MMSEEQATTSRDPCMTTSSGPVHKHAGRVIDYGVVARLEGSETTADV